MEPDKTQVAPMPRPSGSARPRLVLGMVLLIVGLGDLLFMSIVLLPQVLAESDPFPAPTVSAATSKPWAPNAPEAGSVAMATEVAPSPTEEPMRPETAAPVPPEPPLPEAPTRSPAAGQVAQPSAGLPAPATPPAPAPVAVPSPAPRPERAASAFATLRFYRNSAWLSPEAEETLAKLADRLKADSSLRVTLDGHTDDFGPERFNQLLSLKRAQRARARLQDLGIGRARIDIKAYGSEQPLDAQHTAKARALNRRVEITVN